ncbi:hypothetical protein OBBRIDRAFT_667755 [Obba rivulosa]|uniref:Uncharacterized protein n=1 Tax=Obba rivulosa TaxID=1052685 RepID=A0A8E2ARN8_9APHY|nr:hypothetical protein OBBRIDRAFT_667755 [Obba rivulosa]
MIPHRLVTRTYRTMLQANSLYLAIYARDTPDDYHWALYYHGTADGGTKFHIRNLGQGWIAEHEQTNSIMKQFLLIGLMKFASIRPDAVKALHDTIVAVPYNAPGINCRTWVLDAIQAVMSAGLIHHFSLDQLETEAKVFGFNQFDAAVQNVQPRPVTTSVIYSQ